jgi:hypothetical protein
MQRAMLNRATMRVANTTEVSGRVTADSIKQELYAKKQTNLWRLTIFGCVVSVGVLACLAPMPVLAQGQQGDQGQFVDPIEGSWIVHVTVDTYTPNPGFYATLPVRRSPVILGKWHHYYFRSY